MTSDVLNEAWARINALGSPDTAERPDDQFAKGINHAVDQALNIIEQLGGRDPLAKRQAQATARMLTDLIVKRDRLDGAT